jgi:hypothetical protein
MITSFRMIRRSIALAGLVSLFSGMALADGPQAIATAVQHSGLAASGTNIDAVHRHLHHVLNCLVGPDGDGFDAAQGNPCAAAGGAISQTADAAMKMKLEMAATQVRGGSVNTNINAAKKVATDVQVMLR